MSLSPCNPCCCSDCTDKPRQLLITASYGLESGVTLGAGPNNAGQQGDVSTKCTPPAASVSVARVRSTSAGGGYTAAPSITLSGGGGEVTVAAVATATVTSPIREITITSGGSGYKTAPLVSFPGPADGVIRAAKAEAAIEGAVTSVTLTGQGQYASTPSVSIAGGTGAQVQATIGNGFVSSITLTDGGSGYTSPPSVVIDGNATAVAYLFKGAVYAVYMTSGGSGYSTVPQVQLQGGGGTGAKATANALFSVVSLAVTAGGQGYPENPAVSFSGGGEVAAATATATISGSVVSVQLSDAGSYKNVTKSSDGSWRIDWPTVKFASGSAQASLSFSGGVSLAGGGGAGYTVKPAVVLSGGGGNGAAGEADLTWMPSQTSVVDIRNCQAVAAGSICTSTTVAGGSYPPVPCGGCGSVPVLGAVEPPTTVRFGERLSYSVRASTTALTGSPSARTASGNPRELDLLFDGEAAYVHYRQQWSGNGGYWDEARQILFPDTQTEETVWLKRLFTRVQPQSALTELYETAINSLEPSGPKAVGFSTPTLGLTLSSVSLPVVQPVFASFEDMKGDVFWQIVGLVMQHPGANLFIAPDQTVAYLRRRSGNGYYWNDRVPVVFTAAYSPPDVFGVATVAFSREPVFSFGFSPSWREGDYLMDSASVTDQGETTAPNGTYPLGIILRSGHAGAPLAGVFGYTLPYVTYTIAGGKVTGVDIISGGLIRGPANLATVTLDSEAVDLVPRIATGKSTFTRTEQRTAPTLTATAGGAAVLGVNLTQTADQNNKSVWRVSSVTVSKNGTGYKADQEVTFSTTDTVAESAVAKIVIPSRETPTLVASVSGGIGGQLSVSYTKAGQAWQVSSVSVASAGTGYTPFSGVTFSLGENDVEQSAAYAYIDSDAVTGAITSATVSSPGSYYKQPTSIQSISVLNGGRYYAITITETAEPLPEAFCKGSVESSWSRRRYAANQDGYPDAVRDPIDAGTKYTERIQLGQGCWKSGSGTYNDDFTRTRTCSFPELTFEFQ